MLFSEDTGNNKMPLSFEQFLLDYPQHLDSPEWLSRGIIHLSVMLYELGTKIHQAELDEARITINYLDQIRDGKRMAVSEAEKRALIDTGNARHLLQNSNEAVQEIINSIKKRLDVLAFDYRMQGRN